MATANPSVRSVATAWRGTFGQSGKHQGKQHANRQPNSQACQQADAKTRWFHRQEHGINSFCQQDFRKNGRKHGIDFCFGFQNVSQGKANYGELWNSIASAPYSKIVMRTGEPEGADHGSKMLGEHDVERLIEHRGQDGTRTYTTQPYDNVRLVTGSDLGDLDNRVGFLRHGKYVTKIKLAIPAWRPDRCEAFVRRTGIAPVQLPMPNLVEIQAKEAADKAKFAQKAASYVYDPNLKPHQTTQQQRGRKKPAANQGPLPFSE